MKLYTQRFCLKPTEKFELHRESHRVVYPTRETKKIDEKQAIERVKGTGAEHR